VEGGLDAPVDHLLADGRARRGARAVTPLSPNAIAMARVRSHVDQVVAESKAARAAARKWRLRFYFAVGFAIGVIGGAMMAAH
jgi:hypothetical protein